MLVVYQKSIYVSFGLKLGRNLAHRAAAIVTLGRRSIGTRSTGTTRSAQTRSFRGGVAFQAGTAGRNGILAERLTVDVSGRPTG